MARTGKPITHEVNAAVLPGGIEDLGDGHLGALMHVGDDQQDTVQSAANPGAQEVGPEGRPSDADHRKRNGTANRFLMPASLESCWT